METSDVSQKAKRFYVYILQSQNDLGLHIGYTINLKNRLISHARGDNLSTKDRVPFKLIHYEYFVNIYSRLMSRRIEDIETRLREKVRRLTVYYEDFFKFLNLSRDNST